MLYADPPWAFKVWGNAGRGHNGGPGSLIRAPATLDFKIQIVAVGDFPMPYLESLINSDEVAFANRVLAVGVAGMS